MRAWLSDTLALTGRHLRSTLRLPIWIAVNLAQPVIWLAVYAQLFRRVVELPGFDAPSYLQFLTPGIVVMSAMFGAAWNGTAILEDINDGVMDRILATPASRFAILCARVLHTCVTVGVQSCLILGMGFLLGARYPGGAAGVGAVLLMACLLGAGFSALSNGLALITRRDETMIALINFLGLPITFTSSAFMAAELMPPWMRLLAKGNPVEWAVGASRHTLRGEWGGVGLRFLLLTLFAAGSLALATQAFRAYRRSA